MNERGIAFAIPMAVPFTYTATQDTVLSTESTLIETDVPTLTVDPAAGETANGNASVTVGCQFDGL